MIPNDTICRGNDLFCWAVIPNDVLLRACSVPGSSRWRCLVPVGVPRLQGQMTWQLGSGVGLQASALLDKDVGCPEGTWGQLYLHLPLP